MKIDIDISAMSKELSKDLKKYQRDCIPIAEKAALLRSSRSALSRWIKGVSKQRKVKQKLIRKRCRNYPLSGRKSAGSGRVITMNGAPMPVSIMGPNGKLPKQTRNGIRIAGRHYPRGFIAGNRLGSRPLGQTIFSRDGAPRVPISEERIELMGAVRAVGPPAVRRAIEQRYPIEFKHALQRALKRKTRAR